MPSTLENPASPVFSSLGAPHREYLRELLNRFRFTHQETRLLIEWARDLEMWQEEALRSRWERLAKEVPGRWDLAQQKKFLFEALRGEIETLKKEPRSYRPEFVPKPEAPGLRIEVKKSDKNIFGDCPVASPKTVCCNLKTIDAVENCAFGCSYCTIQTFYGDAVTLDADFGEKLRNISLDPSRFYHIGTGQSSDSLVWGNRNGILDDLCEFAAAHPKILLELKTKSANVAHFLNREVPHNLVLSWSLNSETVIEHEEHFTASLEKRIESARKAADAGIGVAFHFHPMVYYEGWDRDYPEIAEKLKRLFSPEEVIFISMGTLTFIKPVVQAIRKKGHPTKTLQMEMVPDPHGKLTYPDPVKVQLFNTLYRAFGPWQKSVYFYLCMEKAEIWDPVFGGHYPTNEAFESDFGRKTLPKLTSSTPSECAGLGH